MSVRRARDRRHTAGASGQRRFSLDEMKAQVGGGPDQRCIAIVVEYTDLFDDDGRPKVAMIVMACRSRCEKCDDAKASFFQPPRPELPPVNDDAQTTEEDDQLPG